MSDDAWFGDTQEPAPGSAPYGQGQGRRAARGRQQPPQPQPEQSGQYAQQYPEQYPQDPYQANQYPQSYAAQPQQSYYDELGPRDTPPQEWNTQQQGYSNPQSYQSPQQQPQPTQAPYGRRPQPQAQPQPSRPVADPYASGSYGTDSYASDGYSSSSGSYSTDPYAADPYASGGYARPARDGYASGGYPAPEQDPRQSTGTYSAPGGYSTGSYSTGGYPAGPGAGPVPGRAPRGPQGQPQPQQPQDPYGRRAAAASNGYTQYGDDDEYPSRSSSRRGYGETDGRSDSAAGPSNPPRSRRRAAGLDDEDGNNDGRFNLIDDEDEDDAGSGRGGKTKQKKGRNCLAVFIAFSVIAGGLGYGGYKGVQWYQSKYGTPPDFVSTAGTGTKVDITIPSGSGGKTIGGLLFNAGVVKSQRAFTDACNANVKCGSIQAGTYLLPKGISATAAVTALLDPKNQDGKSQLITYGGERASQVFAALEAKTGWKDADIRSAIAGGQIGLPAWDTGQPGAKYPYAHIEGFIASQSYVLTDYKTPTDLLKKMVGDQLTVFNQEDMANKAKALNLTEYKLLIIASLARAEAGTNTADLNKIAGVVFNRFDSLSFEHLGFDTSTLYGMGNTGTVPNNGDKANPYNTSVSGIKGLPPSPIDNPDQPSIDAAINPNRANKYYYFCATPDGVQYAANNTQWQNLGQKYKGLCGTG